MSLIPILWWMLSVASAVPASSWSDVRAGLQNGTSVAETMRSVLEGEQQVVRDGLLSETPAERRARRLPLEASTSRAVSAHLTYAPKDRSLAAAVLHTVMRRKGWLVDADVALRSAVLDETRTNLPGRRVLQELERTSRRIASLKRRQSPDPIVLAELGIQLDALQRELATHAPSYRRVAGYVDLGAIASTLGRRTLLVEFVVFRPWDLDADAFGEAHYAVYTLDRAGTILAADLGPVGTIDEAVRALRSTIDARRDALPLADELRARLFGELPWVVRAPKLVMAPDGLLVQVPFEIVLARTADAEYNVPRITYLTSGRERPVGPHLPVADAGPVVVYDVDYGEGRSFLPMQGTAAEAGPILGLDPQASVLQGAAATTAALRRLAAPQLLHLATHGALEAGTLPRRYEAFVKDARGHLVEPAPEDVAELVELWPALHPALRSGVALAGANAGQGFLTTADLANLDLGGSNAMLTAVGPGAGELRNGDGLQGLRRALVLAGTQTQVLSLWRSDDKATAMLVAGYIERLAAGSTVAEALRHAKHQLSQDPAFRHPWFWAGFVVSGRDNARLR